MAEDLAPAVEIDPAQIGTLELPTRHVPYVNLADAPAIRSRLDVSGTTYLYHRTIPVQGHSAILPDAVAEALADGHKILVAERGGRYFLFIA